MNLPRAIEIQPRLPVSGLVASCQFYRDILGFECPDSEPTEAAGFAILQRDTIGLQLVTASPDHPAGQMTIWIHVADALAEHERIKSHAPIEWGPEVYWYGCSEFAVLDPDGHRIIFSSPTGEPPTCRGDEH